MRDELVTLYTRLLTDNTRLMYTMYNDFVSRARENERMLANLIIYNINNNRIQSSNRNYDTPNNLPNRSEENEQNREHADIETDYQNMIRNMRRYYSNNNTNNYRDQLRNNIRNQINSTSRTNNYQYRNEQQNTQNTNNLSYYDLPQSNNSINNILSTFDNLITTSIDELMEPVIVRPTQQQVQVATQRITYNNIIRPVNTRCPISLTEFNSNSEVMMINYCRHLFYPNEILNWFRSNVRCPICRYDIREYSRPIYTYSFRNNNNDDSISTNEEHINRVNIETEEENNHENTEHESSEEIKEDDENNHEDDNSINVSDESEILPNGEINNILNTSLTDALFNDIYDENLDVDSNNEN